MTAALTPALALAYLRELSLDVRSAVVLDAAGEPLAGDPSLAARARELLASSVERASATTGDLLVARAPDGRAIAAIAGDLAIRELLEHDLRATAAALAAPRSGGSET
ncbi:MAG TPA: hypothetical protein VN635_09900 [Conexibacter sp.]|nr:hypothetical protein [Conexibacter sp.]